MHLLILFFHQHSWLMFFENLGCLTFFYFSLSRWNRGRIFSEISRFFPRIAGNSAETGVNLLRTADAPLSWKFCWALALTAAFFRRKTVITADILQKNSGMFFLILMQKNAYSSRQFTGSQDIPRGPIKGHDDPMALIPDQLWFSNGSSLR